MSSVSTSMQAIESAKGLGKRIRAWRDQRGWTQEELAEMTGIQVSAISHFETGRRLPSFENLYRLCVQMGCPASYILNTPF